MTRTLLLCTPLLVLVCAGCSDPLAPDGARVDVTLQVDATGDPHHPVTASAMVTNTGHHAVWHSISYSTTRAPFSGPSIEFFDPSGRRVATASCERLDFVDTGFSETTFMLPGEAFSSSTVFAGEFCPGDRPWASGLTSQETWTVRASFLWSDGRGHWVVVQKQETFAWHPH